ncbi:hypothetical protein [Gulosibacter hominis]|uniref:hypothetical protein n=1 Tax=Gulosibacter hominis TaxID=2770504 RepID=UPI001E2E7038|nr:hypothetical protein [Gulosibacter hominis]
MKRWPPAMWGVLFVTLLTVIYLVVVVGIAWGLIASGDLIAIAMGAALIIFPLFGAVLVVRDLMFAMQGNHLLQQLAEADALPEDNLPKRPSGRVVREAADADFERWKTEVEAAPESWAAWARLSLAYRAAGDTNRARAAMRQAIGLERAERNQAG